MRHALSDSFGGGNSDWHIEEASGAPPVIANLPTGIYCGLSHSADHIVFAMATSPVGVDLESMAPRHDFAALAEGFMNREELAALPVGEDDRMAYFYRLWCAKEAFYKFLPPADQSVVALAGLAYRELSSAEGPGYLLEAQAARFGFAAVTRTRPDSIDCHLFHCSPNDLTRALERQSRLLAAI